MTASGKTRSQGFTLVELLVVISIIALLLSVLMPALSKARESARTIVCLQNCRSIGLAFAAYTSSNKGLLPEACDMSRNVMWYQMVMPYIAGQGTGAKREAKVFRCLSRRENVTSLENSDAKYVDYGVNYAPVGGIFQYYSPGSQTYEGAQAVNLSSIKTPSMIFQIMDSRPRYYLRKWISVAWVYAPYAPWPVNKTSPQLWPFDQDSDYDGTKDTSSAFWQPRSTVYNIQYNWASHRHNKAANVAFVDGHAENVKTKEWTLRSHWTWTAK